MTHEEIYKQVNEWYEVQQQLYDLIQKFGELDISYRHHTNITNAYIVLNNICKEYIQKYKEKVN